MHPVQNAKETGHSLHGKKRLQFIWDYYKLPIAVLCITVYAALSILHSRLAKKDILLYTALVNVAAGDDLTDKLDRMFLESENIDPSKNMLRIYSGLYLTEDTDSAFHEYTFASRTKILAAIDAEQLDVVLMNKEAFDSFSQNGYLCSLDKLLSREDPALFQMLEPYFMENAIILEDNKIDLYLDESADYHARTETHLTGLDLSACPAIQDAGFEDTVYLGIVDNSPRKNTAVAYLQYLYKDLRVSAIYLPESLLQQMCLPQQHSPRNQKCHKIRNRRRIHRTFQPKKPRQYNKQRH